MCRIASLFFLQRLKESMSLRAPFQRHGEANCHHFSFPARQGLEGSSRHFDINFSATCTIVCHRQNWVAQFKRGDLAICAAPSPGRPITVTIPDIIDQIHGLILEARRILDKSIAAQLGNSHERVGSIIHEDLDMRNLSAKWVPKCLKADQKRQRCQSPEQLLEFLRRDPNDFLSRRDW